MDDNLDEYQAVAGSSEFKWTRPGLERKTMDKFSSKYTVELQTLEPRYIPKSREVVEEDHCQYDIICANLKIFGNPKAKSCLGALMEKRMYEGNSVVAIELETQKVLGVIIAVERFTYRHPEPDELEDQVLEKDIHYIEELRCLLVVRARTQLDKCMVEGDKYLEVVLLCGSRETANHFEIEVVLIDALIKVAELKQIKFLIVISDYRKHQLHLLSLGFTKVSEMAYGTINSQFEQKKFPKTDASSSMMCLLLKLVDRSRLRQLTQFEIRWSAPIRRATRLKLAFY
ncbi:uncharacterized protein [Halyomorpha halys]|uniref:uncharacterized protein n=1 Tax=Halyomorpha halys TaxID=286706 RepID=UPI0006D4D3AD|nr:uncharacterized protein LOC106690680 [Halyomorpha halys]